MSLMSFFRAEKKSSAQMAKERLQVVVAHRRAGRGDHPEYFPRLQKDLLRVLRKYVQVNDDAVQMGIEREGDLEVLELNITLPENMPEQPANSGQQQSSSKNKAKARRQSRKN